MPTQRLFLVAAPYLFDYGPMRKAAGTYFPLGIGYIAAFAKEQGYNVRFFDPNVTAGTIDEIVTAAAQYKPALVGVSLMTPQFTWGKTFAETFKKRCPAIPLVLGGAHPSAMPEQTLTEIPADFVVVGEGEETTVDLLRHLTDSPGRLGEIKGLVWKEGSRIVANAPREPLQDLDSLPFPDRGLIDQSLYGAQSFLSFSKKSMAVHTARGCPGRCVYCASGHKLRSPVRYRSVDNVLSEITALRRRYGTDYVLFKDDTFTWRKDRVRELCAAIRSHHPDLRWHCMGRVNTVDQPLLAEMKEAGLNDIFFGIESGNDQILRRAGKGITTQRARRAVEACAKLGIRTYGAFILGLPGDSRETIEQTIEFACSLPLTMAGFSILVPYPGTKVFEDFFPHDDQAPLDYEAFIASTGIHYVDGYTGLDGLALAELPFFVSRAQRRFYLNPRRVMNLLRSATPSMLFGYLRGSMALLQKEVFLARKGVR